MRAIRVPAYGEPAVLEPADVSEPTPDATAVRIDVAAAGINFADLAKRRGTYPDGPTPPYVPGIEVAGRIAEAGDRTDFEPGDAVAAYVPRGGYAESVVVAADRAFPVSDGLSLREATAVPIQWVTAHNALFEWGGLETPGSDVGPERVLVHAGAGGVGSAAVQLAAAAGAEVFATASTVAKREFAADLGADHAIAYDAVPAAIEERGEGVDLVLDGVGGDAFDRSMEALAPGGRIVAYGLASGEVPTVSTPELLFGNHSVIGYHLGEAAENRPERVYAALEPLDSLLSSGDVEVVVDRTFPLEEADEAHRYVRNRRSRGKVLLLP
ncbi:Alcohol dehydrogenase zinc-binding domain protein [Haloterrigena turkmenica DSM 5511]|uniref:Alcohol dehydrogenase zinc-binding domain protein n=1 Tax=Haloterrigena turkmenica (strain ATCC 51198 / DSM 5511 / JCM 9101 / NCIMB 13204 / VKM B-1734 / 4k) TaxID=543526 RepID=D2RWU4_HALTV|nr:zinc-binding dehydrogenase [Haloterrigena turkmenica]ADB61595.1 Alcohol dehydrogenase zinc-binding domain protein [Haloterrigena turkmenica DSM 5511]